MSEAASPSRLLPNAGDLEFAIHRALEAHDMPAVVGLLRLLVAVDVRRAAAVYDLLQLALVIRETDVPDKLLSE